MRFSNFKTQCPLLNLRSQYAVRKHMRFNIARKIHNAIGEREISLSRSVKL